MNPDVIFNDRYRLDANIGEGGMAVVYRGYDLILRRQVAIKVLRDQFSSDPRFLERFDFEAQAAAKLSHPNIVTTYDVGKSNGNHYIVQEYVAGETLATLMARERRLPESVAVRYARQICGALAAAHRNGVLHRDVKPSNVLITREDVVRLTDFGIAGALESHTGAAGRVDSAVVADEAVLGSLPYCAPEVLTSDDVREPADLYAIGAVLYEMTTGEAPYRAASADELAREIVNGPQPEVGNGRLGADLAPIVARLLRKSPAERYQSAGELLAALRRISRSPAEEEEEAGAATTPDSATRILRRRERSSLSAAGPELPPEPAPPVWRAGRALAMAAAIIGIFVIASVIIAAQRAASHSVRIPNLTGKSVADAISSLRALGVDDIAIRQQPDPAVQGGLIDGTDPPLDTPVRSGSRVTLLVSDGPPTIDVPNVLGQDPNAARQFLATQGFDVRFGKNAHSPTIRAGLVAATNPAPGAPIAKGGVITIAVSSGPALVQVPNVVSMTVDDARKALAKLGLKLAVSSQIAVTNVPAGVVLSQDPNEHANLAPGSAVMVDVSAGSAEIEVPQVVGQSLDDARQSLTKAGLAVGNVVQAAVPDQAPGTVVSQTPGAFARVSEGAVVDLVVAAGGTPLASPGTTQPNGPAGQVNTLIPVPNVIGMTVDEAKSVLERHGYHVDRVTVLPNSTPNNLRVIGTDPPVGTTPPPGSNSITLLAGQ